MPAPYTIPNRPAGTDPRSIADILSNFDYVTDGLDEIADDLDGKLTNSNISPTANINGSKFLAGSVDTTQLAALAVVASKLDLFFQTATAVASPGTGVGNVMNSIASVPPGTYLVVASLSTITATVWGNHTIGATGGWASVTANPDGETVFAVITVTATTTIQQKSDTGVGSYRVNLLVAGIKA